MNQLFAVCCRPLLSQDLLHRATDTLPPVFQDKISTSRLPQDRALRAGAFLLLKKGLQTSLGLSLWDVHPHTGIYGKPHLYIPQKTGMSIFYNASHSGEWALCAFSSHEVGADIQQEKALHPHLAHRFFAPSEVLWLEQQADFKAAFFRLWVLKESYMKYTGQGFHLPLKSFAINFSGENRPTLGNPLTDSPCYFTEFSLSPSCRGAVCTASPHGFETKFFTLEELL